MNPLEILIALKKLNITPAVDGNQLKLTGDVQQLPNHLLEQVKTNKQELLAFLRDSAGQGATTPIAPVEVQDSYPTSNAQKRLWVLGQFEGGTAAYNIITGLHLKGEVNRHYLERAFQVSIDRHESLRTVFREIEGEPRQVVLPHVPFAMLYAEIAVGIDTDSFLHAELEQAHAWSFDLENAPLLKVKLIRMASQEYAMLFGMHHIISDGWSMGVLIQEVLRAYTAIYNGQALVLPPLRVQYKDYVCLAPSFSCSNSTHTCMKHLLRLSAIALFLSCAIVGLARPTGPGKLFSEPAGTCAQTTSGPSKTKAFANKPTEHLANPNGLAMHRTGSLHTETHRDAPLQPRNSLVKPTASLLQGIGLQRP